MSKAYLDSTIIVPTLIPPVKAKCSNAPRQLIKLQLSNLSNTMKICQKYLSLRRLGEYKKSMKGSLSEKAQLVIVFGERKLFEQMQVYSKVREEFSTC